MKTYCKDCKNFKFFEDGCYLKTRDSITGHTYKKFQVKNVLNKENKCICFQKKNIFEKRKIYDENLNEVELLDKENKRLKGGLSLIEE